ncbi:DEAD/DEAH box helicase [Polaromonas naphthalenivorans]|uniref:Helicase domain protein n=1 Tax=Polaromonas naphthalenivorans (strain CJ2) TaxID=365044 RepID=A1VWE8_POLNA|nr:DEAD/DEAH box helicase [Polaromonas naphthalenivorans]ABM39976.1 helicase domain protein [Polaromonas naphthalenivorans CJ2]
MPDLLMRADPLTISTALKEAVVDALVNLTFQRISGHGPEGSILFGARPRALLSSAFLLPVPAGAAGGDEVTQPIQICAHGLDFQVSTSRQGPVVVQPRLQVYVRVLPSVEDMARPDCVLRFRLNDVTRRDLQAKVSAALKAKWAEMMGTYKRRVDHPGWKTAEDEIRTRIHADLGLPRDLKTLFSEEPEDASDEEGASANVAEDGAAEEGFTVPGASAPELTLKDSQFQPMDIPHKWLRLPLPQDALPTFILDPQQDKSGLREACELAASALNGAIGTALLAWATSPEGLAWGFRTGIKVYPSEYKGWAAFLEKVRASGKPVALPAIKLGWDARVSPDWLDPARASVHVSLENRSEPPKKNRDETDDAVFQVDVTATLPRALHRPLKLGRVEASYRYNKYLDYPATGFNGGVEVLHSENPQVLTLRTTWSPRYTQPRIVPKSYTAVNPHIRALSEPQGLAGLLLLGEELDAWLATLPSKVHLQEGLSADDVPGLLREQGGFAADTESWKKEIQAIHAGLRILKESKAEWDKTKKRGPQSSDKAAVYEAWLAMNETMAELMKEKLPDDSGAWRLFQIAFIVANVPAIASRMKCFGHEFDRERDDTVTLLYFATGGGKSEAFFGLLVLNLFFDRLRGKKTGVTAMLRYPLRLLTIQQAQRCARVLAKAELVRRKHGHGGDAFALGFWVGSGGSPNHPGAPGMDLIPPVEKEPPTAKGEAALLQTDVNYELQKAAWNKIPNCPFCKADTALRLFPALGGTLAHVCTSASCASNIGGWQPLPFYICDSDIYDLAPSVLLGTVDKLALIGQSAKTLRRIYGMLGAAPWRHKATGRLRVPQQPKEFAGGPAAHGCEGLFPAYPDGIKLFHDPFPSLLIQDEAHLLDESLGTFAGLFESALDAILAEMSKPLHALVTFEPDGQTRRRAKVIAASATVSEPQRQMEHLYQRPVPAMQFPFPGQSLYESFYAGPKAPSPQDTGRAAFATRDIEKWASWSRVYVAFMTNGRPHTATTVSVLSNFHTLISEFLMGMASGDTPRIEALRARLTAGVSEGPLCAMYVAQLEAATDSELATLIDLHRIALTYVTNKKGGDQIMAAEFEETRKRHADRGLAMGDLKTKLISGSVSQGDIQHTIEDAQRRPAPGHPMGELGDVLRSVIATSSISHGVDVDEFNAMFFAGMPSDIAEYIQASSRVGRTHVGFIVLIPTPQRRRDRYIVEVFDSFHRFLERMVQPAAIDRWAGKAIERVLPSFIQTYLTGVRYMSDITWAEPEDKENVASLDWIPSIIRELKQEASKKKLVDGLCRFIERAIGLNNGDFAPGGKEHYSALVRDKVYDLLNGWASNDLQAEQSLFEYFREQTSVMNRPMTSLRDVDEMANIHFGGKDLNGRRLETELARKVMIFIRHGVAQSDVRGEGQ